MSPHLGGNGLTLAVAGGPGRIVAILLAVLVGVWVAKRWRKRPELFVFACALVFAFRSYTESVMDAYYPWGALAVAWICDKAPVVPEPPLSNKSSLGHRPPVKSACHTAGTKRSGRS